MFMIPAERLPPGFAEQFPARRAEPAEARPAATTVLIRDDRGELEVLLMKRTRSAGFVPGAYVFPGGRVDRADSAQPLMNGVGPISWAADHEFSFGVAALRETFEEAGILLARANSGVWAAEELDRLVLDRGRAGLLAGEFSFHQLLTELDLTLSLDDLVPIAHWITPVEEPRRFDTLFFLAPLPAGSEVEPDPREMVDAIWISPSEALAEFRDGRLPMVFPTVVTLESLVGFDSVESAIVSARGLSVTPILPRLIRTDQGVGIVLDD